MSDSDGQKQTVDRFDEARDVFEKPLPQTDNAAYLDYVDRLEQKGYRGSMHLNPDMGVGQVLFEVGVHLGYACGLKERDGDE